MKPLFFGTSERRLLGVYEPPASGTTGKHAAIVCYPWGAEYLHAHRTMRQLALRLSAVGFHTLRFDFYGTGDSGGEPTDVDLIGMESDLETAIDELSDISGLAKFTLIGLRLGGTVAAGVASRLRNRIESLVLWDPVVSGSEYLDQLGVPRSATPPLQVQGFPLTERIVSELRTLDPVTLTSKPRPRTLMLVTEQLASHDSLATSERQTDSLSIEVLEDVRPWLEASQVSGKVPLLVLQRILSWLE